MKVCRKCEEQKELTEFRKDRSRPDGHFPYCKPCDKERGRAFYRQNLDRLREIRRTRSRLWYNKNKARQADNQRAWAARTGYWSAYRKANIGRIRLNDIIHVARRRALEHAAGTFTAFEWRDLCDWFGNVCLQCGATGKLSPDHVLPLSRGGKNTIDNLQPLCRRCNTRKYVAHVDYRDPILLANFLARSSGQ